MTLMAEAVSSPRAGASCDVVIVGAGLAGIAAAVRLAEAGRRITLLESTHHLGGRASSYTDPATALAADGCQHVLMGCCTSLVELYSRLGVSDRIQWFDEIEFRARDAARIQSWTLRSAPLPAPLHFLPGGIRSPFFTLGEKVRLLRAIAAARFASKSQQARWRDQRFIDWLHAHYQSQTLIRRCWETLVVSALNAPIDAVSTSAALQVLNTGFLGSRTAFRVGVPRVPLAELYRKLDDVIAAAGGSIELGSGVRSITARDHRIDFVECADGRRVTANEFIFAIPPHRLADIVERSSAIDDARWTKLREFNYSSTIGVELTFSRRVIDRPFIAMIESPVQWVFDVATNSQGEQTIRAVISSADEWIELPSEEIIRRTLESIRPFIPSIDAAHLIRSRAIKARRATFIPAPGVDAIRSATCGACENLLLAGDFVQTGWPATMEGAVRSGDLAAAAILTRSKVSR